MDGQVNTTVSSRHQGGVHVLMGDGAVKFVTDSIEAGDSGAQPPNPWNVQGQISPYGLWGALGTRANKETVSEF
jgi:prepilin-type processing-associated H-X9-DG protein